ncbi:hypothetical protein SARC_05867 [Sphaeroforma arctica JP610]|uniref:RecF/RecN/SMC N-terminal domain-containing protein n=1 Tax=Sphaeroforma arctica JP610 TaxID=667725 RepID=A0A0L0FYC0_9EUKA|nr:hypothetical protein SARC_05867 [Sphaeroforma arctica JP610]KNC81830.1 hypothetical protein SARC_05867 [Sphaeroforma arctica JP610]|eukprot:XP_014155732.1 hypothetical protein SARC_05867 [Sphaeroforma arctica JP610]
MAPGRRAPDVKDQISKRRRKNDYSLEEEAEDSGESDSGSGSGEDDDSSDEEGNDGDDGDDDKIHRQNMDQAEAGIIGKITMKNFMCHEYLEVPFGACINFITGGNGSGKSTTLTALSICLGASAKSTNRGKNLKEHIMWGKQKCTIIVELTNAGEDAFKNEIYGDIIIVERTISQNSASGYKLKSSDGKEVSRKRDDLQEILDFFTIQIDNPVQILTQDNSKEFLSKDDPVEKYNFFYKATSLMQLANDYSKIKETVNSLEISGEEAKHTYDRAKKELKRAEEKVKAATELRKKQDEIARLTDEWAWANHIEVKTEYATVEKYISELQDTIPEKQALLGQCEKKKTTLQKQKKKRFDVANVLAGQRDEMLQRNPQIIAQQKENKKKLRALHADAANIESEINVMKSDQVNYGKEIEKVRQRMHQIKPERDPVDHIIAEKLDQVNQIKQEAANTKEKMESLRYDTRDVESKLESLTGQRMQLDNQRIKVKNEMRNLKGALKDNVEVWGEGISQLIRLIDKNTKFFEKRPVGPLGAFVAVKESEYNIALEASMGKNMSTFLINSHRDAHVMNQLINKVYTAQRFRGKKKPPLMIAKFADYRYNTNTTRAKCSYPTIMDLIEVENTQAFNGLLELSRIEQTIICPSRQEAQIAARHNYKNVKDVLDISGAQITDDSYMSNYKPQPPRFQMDVAGSIVECENEMQRLNAQVQTVDEQINVLKRDLQGLSQNGKHYNTLLRKYNIQIRDSQMDLEGLYSQKQEMEKPEEEEQFEQIIESYEIKIGELNADITVQKERLEEIREKYHIQAEANKVTTAKVARMQDEDREIKQRVDAAIEEVRELGQQIDKIHAEAEQHKHSIAEIEAKIAEMRVEAEQLHKHVVASYEQAKAACPEELTPNDEASVLETMLLGKKKSLDRMERDQGRVEDIEKALVDARKRHDGIVQSFKEGKRLSKMLSYMLQQRMEKFASFKASLKARVKLRFTHLLGQQKFRGQVHINHHKKLLHIKVEPKATENEKTRETKTLSGGERSFSLVCFLIAVWDAMDCPFRALDEFDVFMDMANRKLSMELLEQVAMQMKNRQFIFITPQTMQGQKQGKYKRITRIAPPARGQARLNFPTTA